MKKPIIVLTGPTAVGKTEISIELAKAAGGEIISADSMQVYKQMDIGTAKIKKEQMQGVTHYMIDEWNPDEEFNVMIFQKHVKEIMEDIYNRGKIPILVGGTGFYIQAVLNDIAFTKEKQGDEIRADLQNLAKEKGASYLHHELQKVDKESAEAIHPNNIKRVIRALEYFHLTNYFKFIGGASLDEKRVNKDDVIRYVLEENGIGEEEKKSVIMVGDRKHDVEGAKKTGLSVVGVLYGYGSREELQDAGADYLCETPREVAELLRSLAFADGNSLN